MKVLIVDDTENDRKLLVKLFTVNHYEVTEAGNGLEALDSIRKSRPDLIVSDLLMPRMDGFTLLNKLKKDEETKDIPFVVYTATYIREEDRQFALKLGASRFIIKPEEPKDFLQEIEEVLENHRIGKVKPLEPLIKLEENYLQEYAVRLAQKLEDKIAKLNEEIAERKRVEKTLHQNETRLLEAQRIAKLGDWELDIAGGKFTWSAEIFHLTGFDPSQETPTFPEFLECVHPEDRRIVELVMDSARKGKFISTEFRSNPNRGCSKYFLIILEPLLNPEGKVVQVVGTLQDISERK